MNPDAHLLWRGPALAARRAARRLGMLGPFSIDTYLPAFTGIAQSIGATPVRDAADAVGLSVRLCSDEPVSRGAVRQFRPPSGGVVGLRCSRWRRPAARWPNIGTLVFFRALQGMSAGAGIVVSRAVIRDMFPPADAQRVMSQVTIFFGIAPAIAPMVGGLLFVHVDWHRSSGSCPRRRPLGCELPLAARDAARPHSQPFNVRHLLRGYWQLGANPRFIMLALASGIPFNGMFLYVLSAPVFLGEHLHLQPRQFFWFFILTIAGIMGGAWFTAGLPANEAGASDSAWLCDHVSSRCSTSAHLCCSAGRGR